LIGGLALSNAKLGAVHGFAGPFGGMFDAPHGGICARLLPFVMDANIRALRERQPDSETLQRYDEIAQLLTGESHARAQDGVNFVQQLCEKMNIAPLSVYGLTEANLPVVVEKSSVSSSMQGNPIKLTSDEMHQILKRAL
jgi:alcohol dehydrogenase class IV